MTHSSFREYLETHVPALELVFSDAVNHLNATRPADPLSFVAAYLLKVSNGEKPSQSDIAEDSELGELRCRTRAALEPLRASHFAQTETGANSLPEGLKDFTPLADSPEMKEASEGLYTVELAVARDPSSEDAVAELRLAVSHLAEVRRCTSRHARTQSRYTDAHR